MLANERGRRRVKVGSVRWVMAFEIQEAQGPKLFGKW
jgi:hypothetical protein